jgi:hypothetical protein
MAEIAERDDFPLYHRLHHATPSTLRESQRGIQKKKAGLDARHSEEIHPESCSRE